MKKRKFMITILVIIVIIFLIIGIYKVFSNKKGPDPVKENKCVNNENEAIEYLTVFYGKEAETIKYKVQSYDKGIYTIASYKDNEIYMYYFVDDKNCNITPTLYFGIKAEEKGIN